MRKKIKVFVVGFCLYLMEFVRKFGYIILICFCLFTYLKSCNKDKHINELTNNIQMLKDDNENLRDSIANWKLLYEVADVQK